MATLTESIELSYDASRDKAVWRFVIDGKTYRQEMSRVSTSSLQRDTDRAAFAQRLVSRHELRDEDDAVEVMLDVSNWDTLPENDRKKRIGQRAVRRAMRLAAEAFQLSQKRKTRPEAACKWMEARKLLNSVVPHVPGASVVEKRNYLNLTAAEWGQEGGAKFLHDQFQATTVWADVVTWMTTTVSEPLEIDSEVQV